MKPVIGISTSVEDGRQHLDLRYLDAIEAAGGVPRILPAARSRDTAEQAAAGIQALIIPGGPAMAEGLIGELPADIDPVDPRRQRAEGWYLDYFLSGRQPVLGICYGMQLINARAGGTIYADVQAQIAGATVHSSVRGGTAHGIDLEPSSNLARILGPDVREANTYHIQAIATVGQGLRVSARAPDGVIEGIESEDGRLMGVQFHPERQLADMLPLFRHIVERASGS